MPTLGPIKRKDLVTNLRKAGFSGPYSGGKHEFMKNGSLKLPIPNPHQGDISLPLLNRILQKAGISEAEWEQL
jgi:predicted RNA binding protein YcfA (HicA-like mRNA interferase family)